MQDKFKHFEIVYIGDTTCLLCQPNAELNKESDSSIIVKIEEEFGKGTFIKILVLRKKFYQNYFAFCSIVGSLPSYTMAKWRYSKMVWMTVFVIVGKIGMIFLQIVLLAKVHIAVIAFFISVTVFLIVFDLYRLYKTYQFTYLLFLYECELNKK